eukprot:CAMPEP_0172565852 /NCGR_PEP_ID=MMETSP1067-20121228/109767_1 /TAXON_ID=265564 ORGANISM="Thalassiosira punctigera, Strain Tpunct2005C2" /NCGR_SAMPLE_ID=MMETSP1067 /ASSEMBLY_ACC=CAM_ASM_000444 /LENGTH=42 /DNA_ID= /DNA_START= /DNA_END= /DNA_ORIENTATION=
MNSNAHRCPGCNGWDCRIPRVDAVSVASDLSRARDGSQRRRR